MRVRVRLFAVARQAARRTDVELELPEGAVIAQLREELGRKVPQLSRLLDQVTFAVNAEYAEDTAVIPPGADVACIPPVSGG